jgi:hypothetical protein
LKKIAIHYAMIGDKMYKRGFATPMLPFLSELESQRTLKEIRDGSCRSHIGGRSLAGKVIRAGFFWPTIVSDAKGYVRSCDKCHRYAELHHAPREPLKTVMTLWPFYMRRVDILCPFPASQGQAKHFYWKKIICRFGQPKYIVSDNGTQFTSEKVIQFCEEKGIRNTFFSVEHPQANGHAESANTVILKAIKRKLEAKDKNWTEPLASILWSYHTSVHSTTRETPFQMVFGTDAMIHVEINPPSWRRETTTEEENNADLKETLDLLEEVGEAAHFREFAIKQRASRKHNTKVMPRNFKEGDLVLKRPMGKDKGGKLAPNWEGLFRINEAFENGAYRLETLKGEVMPRTWKVSNLRFYYN